MSTQPSSSSCSSADKSASARSMKSSSATISRSRASSTWARVTPLAYVGPLPFRARLTSRFFRSSTRSDSSSSSASSLAAGGMRFRSRLSRRTGSVSTKRLSPAYDGDFERSASSWTRSTRRAIESARSNGSRVHGSRKSRHSVSEKPARRRRSVGPSSSASPGRLLRLALLNERRTPSGGEASTT